MIDKYIDNARLGKSNLALFIAGVGISLGLFFFGQVPLALAVIIEAANGQMSKDILGNVNLLVEEMGFAKFFILIAFQFVFLLVGTLLCIRFFHQLKLGYFWSAIGKFRFKHFLLGFLITLVLQGGYITYTYFTSPEEFTWNFQPKEFYWLVFIAIIIVPIQTLAEEVFFRGYIYQQLGFLVKNKWIAWIVSGVFFGCMHLLNPEVSEFGFGKMALVYIGTGLMIGLSIMFTEGLEFAWGYHLVNNFILTVFISFPGSALQGPTLYTVPKPDSNAILVEFLISFVLFLGILMIFYPKKLKKIFVNEATPEIDNTPRMNM